MTRASLLLSLLVFGVACAERITPSAACEAYVDCYLADGDVFAALAESEPGCYGAFADDPAAEAEALRGVYGAGGACWGNAGDDVDEAVAARCSAVCTAELRADCGRDAPVCPGVAGRDALCVDDVDAFPTCVKDQP